MKTDPGRSSVHLSNGVYMLCTTVGPVAGEGGGGADPWGGEADTITGNFPRR